MTSIAMNSTERHAGDNSRRGRALPLMTILAVVIGGVVVLSSGFPLTGRSGVTPDEPSAPTVTTTATAAVTSDVAPSIVGSESVTRDDRAVAFGRLIDSPQPREVLDEGIRIAEALRRRYRIDTGDIEGDRRQAADRARVEVLETMAVSEDRIEKTARDLGYSLDPSVCSNYCDNVRRLALLVLEKQTLEAFAEGRPDASNSDVIGRAQGQ